MTHGQILPAHPPPLPKKKEKERAAQKKENSTRLFPKEFQRVF